MNIDQKRIKIAEACGWRQIDNADGDLAEHHLTRTWTQWLGPKDQEDIDPPDYFNDLNACHEMEKGLSVQYDGTQDGCRCYRYIRTLHEVCGGVPNCFSHHCATSTQRAEAFGLTLGLWKEGGV